ncbi:MAG: CPBP family intramembrane metalloprotease [Lachnospiraceae bacterium]|nr:CPBP family intramembrane metalloprotease [Lachnospiraceae bacterium]
MKKLYEKNKLTFAIVWIVIYCFVQSLANSLNEIIGIEYAATAAFCILQTAVLFVFLKKNGLFERYGLCRSLVPASRFLYYIPLILLATGNLWNGIALNYSPTGTVCRIVAMLCVGFLEEVIFRGFLFKAIAKESVSKAIIISSVTFGIGHIINLLNGSGMTLTENLCQVIFAIAVGFLFVLLFHRGNSLLPCILTHSAINSLSTFANGEGLSKEMHIVHCLILIAITVAYTLVLVKMLPKKNDEN